MDRHGKLLVLLIVVVALAFGGWLLLGSGGGSAVDEPTATESPAAAPAELTTSLAANAPAATPATGRTTIEVAAAEADRDPAILAALARFTGRVLEHGGEPAAQRKVRFYRFDPRVVIVPELTFFSEQPISDFTDAIAGEATTGDDGRFELAGVWPRAIYLVKADAEGPCPTLRLASRTPGPAETVDLGDIVLKNAATAIGIVLDEEGEPVAGATVRAADLPAIVTQFVPIEQLDPEGWLILSENNQHAVLEMPAWGKRLWRELPVPTTTTDAEGRFRLEGIEPGINLVAATKSGLCAAVLKGIKLDAGQTRDVGRMVLREGEVASGRVVDAAGKPVPGIQVVVGNKLHMPPIAFGRDTTTDARGAFSCPGLGTGNVVAAARRGPEEPWTITPAQSIQKDLLITLPTQHVLTVRLASEAGLPIAEPRVRVLHWGAGQNGDEVPMLAVLGLARTLPLAGRERKLDDGRLQITGLDAGNYTVIADATHHAVAMAAVELAGDREVELRLPPERTLAVTVVDRKRAPIRNAAVYVELRGKGPERMPVFAGHTGADGKVTVRRSEGDRATIEAVHPRYGAAGVRVEAAASDPVVIELTDPAAIEGEVSENGGVPPPGKYMIVAHRSWQQENGPMSSMPGITTIDLQGKFALRGLQPGEWRVQVVKAFDRLGGFTSVLEMAMMAEVGPETQQQTVQLTAGETAQVRLDASAQRVVEGPSARVTGTVFVDGRPGEGMVVHGWNEQRLSAVVAASGQFDLGQVKEGDVHLRLSERAGLGGIEQTMWSRMIEVKGGSDVDLKVEVLTASLSGIVLDRDGSPAPGVRIQARGHLAGDGAPAGQSSSFTLSDDEGRFAFKRIPAGAYSISAHAEERGRTVARATVNAGSRAEVRMQLEAAFTIKGRLDRKLLPMRNGEGRWLGVSFEAFDPEGKEGSEFRQSWANVGEDGSFTAEGLLPGRYRARIFGNLDGEWAHDGTIEVVDRDLELVVQPVSLATKQNQGKEQKGEGKGG